MNIPTEIKNIIGDRHFSIDTIGMSDSQVLCFDDMVLKIEKCSEESDNEHNMMAWLSDKLPVPKVIYSKKTEKANYLLMSKLKGKMSCEPEFLENPDLLVKYLVDGLKLLWSVDIKDCPYNNSLDNKLRLAEFNVKNNLCDTENVEPETYGENGFSSPAELLEWLKANRPTEELVFSHGDYCLPNVFFDNGKISGFIDLGKSGIADKYQDIALCYRSLKSNLEGRYGGNPNTEFNPEKLFEQLEILPNWDKIRYYVLLDELF